MYRNYIKEFGRMLLKLIESFFSLTLAEFLFYSVCTAIVFVGVMTVCNVVISLPWFAYSAIKNTKTDHDKLTKILYIVSGCITVILLIAMISHRTTH